MAISLNLVSRRYLNTVTRAALPTAQPQRTRVGPLHISQQLRSCSIRSRPFSSSSTMDKDQSLGQSTEGKSEWKKRPPYRIHDSNEHFDALYEASCHCGKVKYQLNRKEPLDSKLCHCTTCQTQHGKPRNSRNSFLSGCSLTRTVLTAAPFQWAAIFHKDDINFSHGHHNLEWYDPTEKSIEHKLPCKVRCSYCHSPIMDEGRNMILLFPSLIHLKSAEDKANFKPR